MMDDTPWLRPYDGAASLWLGRTLYPAKAPPLEPHGVPAEFVVFDGHRDLPDTLHLGSGRLDRPTRVLIGSQPVRKRRRRDRSTCTAAGGAFRSVAPLRMAGE